jgi:two-component system cell cycle sensor histidine kinase/response regulator CckA
MSRQLGGHTISTEIAPYEEPSEEETQTAPTDTSFVDEREFGVSPPEETSAKAPGFFTRMIGDILDDGGPTGLQLFLILAGSVGIVLLAALSARAPGIIGVAGMVLLAGLFIVTILLLLALASGILPLSKTMPSGAAETSNSMARRIAFDMLDQSEVPCLLAGRNGNGLYANDAYRQTFDVAAEDVVPLEDLFASDPELQAALYRLSKAAGLGLRASEEVRVTGACVEAFKDKTIGSRWLRIEIRPVGSEGATYLWETIDVTEDRTQGDYDSLPEEDSFSALNALPVGVFVVSDEGEFSFANRALMAWLQVGDLEDLRLSQFVTDEVQAERIAGGGALLEDEVEEGWIVEFDVAGETLDFRLIPADPGLIPPDVHGSAYLVTKAHEVALAHMALPAPVEISASSQELTTFLDDAPIGIVTVAKGGTVLSANQSFRAVSAVPALPGDPFVSSIQEEDRSSVEALLEAVLSGGGKPAPLEVHLAGSDGRSGQLIASHIEDAALFGNAQAAAILYFIDTTDQRALELQFTQSQKMQAVGQLAGGVAHDFNNVLTAIIGYCDLLLANHKVGDPSFADLNQIKQNANRAANLVRQLLAFSRRQTMVPRVLQLSNAIAETEMLLKRLLGEKINFVQNQQRELGLVKVDQGQLEQVVVNLAVNARDAMKDGGTLTLTTYNVDESEVEALGHSVMPSAEYVCLEISDTGHGIAKENLGNIFEPFFTTKDVGQGTGLGLSTVYGIVKQTGGFIFPESEEGKGTTFKIYLPRHPDEELPVAIGAGKPELKDLSGEGTVLLVEDEDAVRTFAARALSTRGYRVLEASNGEMGLEIVAEEEGKIDIMVSDVVMPNMDGPTMAKRVKELYPDIKVIFISGYTEDAFEDDLDRPEDFEFLPKPFSLKQLASKVKEVLNR